MIQVVTPIVRDALVESARVPPQSVEAEQSVLGALLLDNSAWDRISDVITEQSFYRADHRTVFHHIVQLIESNKPADALTVAESLERSGKLEDIGGRAYISALSVNTPSAANIQDHSRPCRRDPPATRGPSRLVRRKRSRRPGPETGVMIICARRGASRQGIPPIRPK